MSVARVADSVTRLLLVGVGGGTVLGLFAPLSIVADLANDFRPLLSIAALLAVTTSLVASPRWLRAACAAVFGVNLLLTMAALTQSVLGHSPMIHPAEAGARQLRVVSFNVWTRNARLDESRRWLEATGADVIVLQEFNEHARRAIVAPLAVLYPHVHDCRCNDIAILSRHPFSDAGGQSRTAEHPALSWLTLTISGHRPLKLIGVHTTYPKKPEQHAAHFAGLTTHSLFDDRAGPVALVGDFNATPWSWRFHRFVMLRGLKRHGSGIEASWPTTPLPILLLDNVVTTPDIQSVSFEIGPDIGSDHHPVITTLALP